MWKPPPRERESAEAGNEMGKMERRWSLQVPNFMDVASQYDWRQHQETRVHPPFFASVSLVFYLIPKRCSFLLPLWNQCVVLLYVMYFRQWLSCPSSFRHLFCCYGSQNAFFQVREREREREREWMGDGVNTLFPTELQEHFFLMRDWHDG